MDDDKQQQQTLPQGKVGLFCIGELLEFSQTVHWFRFCFFERHGVVYYGVKGCLRILKRPSQS